MGVFYPGEYFIWVLALPLYNFFAWFWYAAVFGSSAWNATQTRNPIVSLPLSRFFLNGWVDNFISLTSITFPN